MILISMDMLILFCISCRTPPCIVSGTECPSQECSSLLSGCKPSKMAISCFLFPDHGKICFFAAFPASSEATHPLSLATGTGRLRGCQRKSEGPREEMGARLGEWKMVEGRFFFSQGGKALQVRVISQERGRKLGRRR